MFFHSDLPETFRQLCEFLLGQSSGPKHFRSSEKDFLEQKFERLMEEVEVQFFGEC